MEKNTRSKNQTSRQWKPFSQPRENQSLLRSRNLAYAVFGIFIFRDLLAKVGATIYADQDYWGYIYTIGSIGLAVMFHARAYDEQNKTHRLVFDSIAGFFWWDVVDRIFLNCNTFTKEDVGTIILVVFIIYWKHSKWKKAQ